MERRRLRYAHPLVATVTALAGALIITLSAGSASAAAGDQAASVTRVPPAHALTAAADGQVAKPKYDNVKEAKEAFKTGVITKAEYNQIVRQLKARRTTKLDKLKKLFKEGGIDRPEYERRKRVIETEYAG